MKTILISLLVIAMLPCAAFPETTEEFTVVVSGSEAVVLSDNFSHFMISTTADIQVRFIMPVYNSSGQLSTFSAIPRGDASVADDSGPRPDEGDTTFTAYTALFENIYNDVSAKKILFTGSATVTIRAKK